jgi:hypothetical protein
MGYEAPRRRMKMGNFQPIHVQQINSQSPFPETAEMNPNIHRLLKTATTARL